MGLRREQTSPMCTASGRCQRRPETATGGQQILRRGERQAWWIPEFRLPRRSLSIRRYAIPASVSGTVVIGRFAGADAPTAFATSVGARLGAISVLAVLTSHPTRLDGRGFGTGSTEIAPNKSAARAGRTALRSFRWQATVPLPHTARRPTHLLLVGGRTRRPTRRRRHRRRSSRSVRRSATSAPSERAA